MKRLRILCARNAPHTTAIGKNMADPRIGSLVANRKQLREAISEVGTQKEVADAAGIGLRTITKLLNDPLPT